MRLGFKYGIILLMILTFSCRSIYMPSNKIQCPKLDTLFPISSYKGNYEYYLKLEKFYKIKVDSTTKNFNYSGKKVEYGARRVDNDSLFLFINQKVGSFEDYSIPDLLFIAKNLDSKIDLVYKVKNDPFQLSEEYLKNYYNSRVLMGESTIIRNGNLYKKNYDKDFKICVDQAIEIFEVNTVEERGSKYFSTVEFLRSEPYQDPFWIFSIVTNYGSKEFYTVDGVTGVFKKADFMKIFPGAIKVKNPKARKNNLKALKKRKDSIDQLFKMKNK